MMKGMGRGEIFGFSDFRIFGLGGSVEKIRTFARGRAHVRLGRGGGERGDSGGCRGVFEAEGGVEGGGLEVGGAGGGVGEQRGLELFGFVGGERGGAGVEDAAEERFKFCGGWAGGAHDEPSAARVFSMHSARDLRTRCRAMDTEFCERSRAAAMACTVRLPS